MTNHTRQQRRTAQRQMAKQMFAHDVTIDIDPPLPQAGVVTSFLLLVFSCAAFAVVQGYNFFLHPDPLFRVLLWSGPAISLVACFLVWKKHYKKFQWSRKWFFFLPMGLTVGAILGVVYATTLETYSQRKEFEITLEQHQSLVTQMEAWRPSTVWNNAQCQTAQHGLQDMQQQFFTNQTVPTVNQIYMVLSIQQTMYQAGCDTSWSDLQFWRDNPPVFWFNQYPVRAERAQEALQGFWPNAMAGCQIEISRAESLGDDDITALIRERCQFVTATHPWVPGEHRARVLETFRALPDRAS